MMKLKTLVSIAAVFCFAATFGCGGTSNSASTTPATPLPAASPSPASGVQTVMIESPDKTLLVGSLFDSGRPNSRALLLLHQWQSDRHSYDEFAKAMQGRGFTVLAIDGRGFGESVKTSDGKSVAPERTDAAVKGMLQDVGAAFDFLSGQKSVDPQRISIVGASYGSSLALIYAADNRKVRNVVMLSPGLNYFGNMPILPARDKYAGERSIYVIAAADDKESADTVRKLDVRRISPMGFEKIYPAGGHGTALFRPNVGLTEELASYFDPSPGPLQSNVRP